MARPCHRFPSGSDQQLQNRYVAALDRLVHSPPCLAWKWFYAAVGRASRHDGELEHEIPILAFSPRNEAAIDGSAHSIRTS